MSDRTLDCTIVPPVGRREFMKRTATGLLVLIAFDPLETLQEGRQGGGRAIPPTSMPTSTSAPTAASPATSAKWNWVRAR